MTHQEVFVRSAALAVVAVVATLLTGCAVSGEAPTVNVPKAEAPAAEAPPAPAEPGTTTSERGNVVKKVGDVAAFGPTQDNLVVKFVVDKITVGAKCETPYPQKPQNGTFLKLDLRLETSTTMDQSSAFMSVNPFDFSTVGTDGVTESSLWTGPAAGCLRSTDQLPPNLSPGSKYRGAIMLDTRNKSGTLVLKPGFMAATGGWEWQYGA